MVTWDLLTPADYCQDCMLSGSNPVAESGGAAIAGVIAVRVKNSGSRQRIVVCMCLHRCKNFW